MKTPVFAKFLFGCAAAVGLYAIYSVTAQQGVPSAHGASEARSAPSAAPPHIAPRALNSQDESVPFFAGYWAYRVHDVRWPRSLDVWGRERANGIYMVATVSMLNEDRTSSTRPMLKMVDQDDREYDETDSSLPCQLSFLLQLNPTMQQTGCVVFDVPDNDNHYSLRLFGGYESSERTDVNLVR